MLKIETTSTLDIANDIDSETALDEGVDCGRSSSRKGKKRNYKKELKSSCQATERRKWSPPEDNQLVKLINKYGLKSWRIVAAHLKDRTPKQCRERWINHLDPCIVKGKLTEEEWNIVLESQEELGNRWSEIAKLLPGRTPNQIKNVWHAMMRRESKFRKPPKRKLSSISHKSNSREDNNTNSSPDQTRDMSQSSEEDEEISESEEWEPSLKKRKIQSESSSDQLDGQLEIEKEEMNESKNESENENSMSRLEALIEIASDMYELEVEQDENFNKQNENEENENEEEEEEEDQTNDSDDGSSCGHLGVEKRYKNSLRTSDSMNDLEETQHWKMVKSLG